ncbi:MAG: class I SAM-dependent methyltransferase [Firmicutes bacterium]|nr:class I SAM-dependent methyltransferase [Bacillota bacterium]
MNTIWSTYLQKPETLYQTRELRFDDRFKRNYITAFNICHAQNILEIGAGPGALTQALKRWYPGTYIVGSDRDSAFVEFAKARAPDIDFVEADISSLPFNNNSFDATISHSVQEHVEDSKFFGEQYHVLKPGGICIVLSAGRRAINIASAAIMGQSEFEKEMQQKTEKYYQATDKKYNVGKFGCTEQELPQKMSAYGFNNIQTHYLGINLTPDSGQYDKAFAVKMIEANRRVHLDSLEYLPHIAPNVLTNTELKKWKAEINRKYDKRIEQYISGEKQWDVNVSFTMILRGEK